MTSEEINWDCLLANEAAPKETRIEHEKSDSSLENVKQLYIEKEKSLDIALASKLLPWEKIEEFKKQSNNFEVVTFDQCQQALNMSLQARRLANMVEKKRKEITRPSLDFQKGVKAIADAFIDEIKAIEASMSEKVEMFNRSRETKSLEIGIDLQKVEKVEDGSLYEVEYWEFEAIDMEKVPKAFLKLDDKKIKEAVKDGVRNIEGIRIFKTKKTRRRLK